MEDREGGSSEPTEPATAPSLDPPQNAATLLVLTGWYSLDVYFNEKHFQ